MPKTGDFAGFLPKNRSVWKDNFPGGREWNVAAKPVHFEPYREAPDGTVRCLLFLRMPCPTRKAEFTSLRKYTII